MDLDIRSSVRKPVIEESLLDNNLRKWTLICQSGDIDAAKKFFKDNPENTDAFCPVGCSIIINSMSVNDPINNRLLSLMEYLHEITGFSVCYPAFHQIKTIAVLCSVEKCKWLFDLYVQFNLQTAHTDWILTVTMVSGSPYVTMELLEWLMESDPEGIKEGLQCNDWIICAIESLPLKDLKVFMSWITDLSAHDYVLTYLFRRYTTELDAEVDSYNKPTLPWEKIKFIFQLFHEYISEGLLENIFCYICKHCTLDDMKWFWSSNPTMDLASMKGDDEHYKYLDGYNNNTISVPTVLQQDVMLEPLAGACYRGDFEAIKWLLEIAPDLDVHQNDERLMWIACQKNYLHIIKWFVDNYEFDPSLFDQELFSENLGEDPLGVLNFFLNNYPENDWSFVIKRSLDRCAFCK